MNEILMQKPSQLITNTIQCTEYNLYLHGEIGDPDELMEHFAVLKQAGENDLVRLYINSVGGSLSTGMQYIAHMRDCQAPIVAVLGVEVASMASAIALEADSIEVDDMTTMLVHSIHYGTVGTESAVYNQAVFNKKLNERWIRKHYSDFLTEEQLQDVFKGVDVILDSDEILAAWENMQIVRGTQGESEGEEGVDLLAAIEEKVSDGVAKAISILLESFDLVKKPKPQRSRKKPVKKVVDDSTKQD